jgi:hypothetical protein
VVAHQLTHPKPSAASPPVTVWPRSLSNAANALARLAHSRYRSLMLIEGPSWAKAPDVHPHSVDGALVSIAAMWRLPVLHSSDADE